MRCLFFVVFICFIYDVNVYGCFNDSLNEEIIFFKEPVNKQVFPRNRITGDGSAFISGLISKPLYNAVLVTKYRNNILAEKYEQQLNYFEDSARFDFTVPIKAELAMYRIEIAGLNDLGTFTIKTYDSLLSGEAIIIQGQSNAVAENFGKIPSNPENQSPFIRVWGSGLGNYKKQWFVADGDAAMYQNGNAGQWGLRLARKIIGAEKMPIVIFNGAFGGQGIDFFMKDYPGLYNNYSVLKQRVYETGFQGNIFSVFWYQGETDAMLGTSTEDYLDKFNALYKNWNEDYPGFLQLFIMQIKISCFADSEATAKVAEAHRLLALQLPNTILLSTNGLKHLADGGFCHYEYLFGYKNIGDQLYNLLHSTIYKSKVKNIESPSVVIINQTLPNELTLQFKNASDNYKWEAGSENEFITHDSTVRITGGMVKGSTLILFLSESKPVEYLSFYGHMIGGSPCVRNGKGMGIVGFYKMPVWQLPKINTPLASGHFKLRTPVWKK